MEMEGLDEVFRRYRSNPSPMDAVTYYLPRLISGEPMPHGAERHIHRADVYGCEPKDLAARFVPVPQSLKSGDRFFFTLCKRQKGSSNRSSRVAGAGTWTIQKSTNITDDAGVKVGKKKSLCFKKDKATTGWLMEEYRCLRQEAVAADGEKVMCKIYLSSSADSAARQESAAYLRQQEGEPAPPQPEPASTNAPKRPAPVAADPRCPKRTRFAVPTPPVVQQGCSAVFAPPPVCAPLPFCLPASFTENPGAAEADGDMDRFACSLDELLGVCREEEEEEAQNDTYEFATSLEDILGGAAEVEEETLPADDKEEEPEQQVILASDEFAIPALDEFSVIFNMDDMESFTLDDLDMLPADHGEGPEQQVLNSDESDVAPKDDLEEFLESYKREESRSIFRLDQLEGHNEFFSI